MPELVLRGLILIALLQLVLWPVVTIDIRRAESPDPAVQNLPLVIIMIPVFGALFLLWYVANRDRILGTED